MIRYPGVIQPQQVQHRGVKVVDVDFVFDGGAAEFSAPDDERVFEHVALCEVGGQRR